MLTDFLLLIAGFVVLIFGANFLVSGASSLAKRFNISELAIGLTVVAFGTSTPELIVSGISSTQGHNEVAFGNVIGSNVFNLFFILGVAGTVYPIIVQSNTVWKEIPYSLFAAIVLFVLVNDTMLFGKSADVLSFLDGLLLLLFFAAFLYYVFISMKSESGSEENPIKIYSLPITAAMIIGGLAGLIAGGKFVVDSSVAIAQGFGVSEKLIGLTIVAAGTSLPELATSTVAAFKKRSDIAIGNVVGSNIFNIFFILSICSLITPIPYNKAMNFDMYVLGIGTALLFITMFSGRKRKIDRWEAVLLLLAYIGYVYYLIMQE
ncbi:calcium/sodium antiporter [Rhodocytophaga aerolata]|uniref:Calcium/sodium antiporter n=1 Tax=Rhodocytophaga aerolata TaxID=455078 RepID=A0ABT8REP6_9BACT|nr:calcium/sodium antiporter [Rhodocytophaga aerolata]MDO1450454.1 calcium/sodium antiporter [Rhodocytophaga aerolata]